MMQELDQQVALDERAHVAVEQRVPGRAHEERRRLADQCGGLARHAGGDRGRGLLQPEPVEEVTGQREEVRQLADRRKLGLEQHFHWGHALEARQLELHRLHRA
jgi:hypothetical protein